jgi:hypothetical protein
MTNKNTQERVVAKCTQRISALGTYATRGKIQVNGTSMTEAAVEAVYQACLDTRTTLTSLRGQVTAALAARKAADAAMAELDVGMEAWVGVTYGPASQAAVDFGYAKKPVAKPGVAVKAAAAVKAVATRKAHGIAGPKQRKGMTAEAPVAPPAAAPPAAK